MKRSSLWIITLLVVACVAPTTLAAKSKPKSRMYHGFFVDIAEAPPAPRVVYVQQPAVVQVPGSSVYVIDNSDYDVFKYGSTYYLSNDGYWYKSKRSGGPYAIVDVRRVPRQILVVPAQRWKHHPESSGWLIEKGYH